MCLADNKPACCWGQAACDDRGTSPCRTRGSFYWITQNGNRGCDESWFTARATDDGWIAYPQYGAATLERLKLRFSGLRPRGPKIQNIRRDAERSTWSEFALEQIDPDSRSCEGYEPRKPVKFGA